MGGGTWGSGPRSGGRGETVQKRKYGKGTHIVLTGYESERHRKLGNEERGR